MSVRPPIAIVGVNCIFPGSVDKTGFWRDILAGRDLIRDVPPSHWLIEDYYDPDPSVPDKTYAKRGAFIEDVTFDPMEWGVPPSIVPATDTSQLLGLIVAKRVLEEAAHGDIQNYDRDRTSVILGVTSAQELLGSMVSRLQKPVWVKALRDSGVPESNIVEVQKRIESEYSEWTEATFPGLLGNVVAGRIANRLDLGGTNCVTDAACASTFSALSMAVNELYLGQSDCVIAGGVDTMNDIFMYMCFSKTPALSATGDVRPFSDQADGTMLGEGMAMFALKRLDDAERDGDNIYGLLNGIGTSSDGRSKSVYAPVSEGQAKALRRAYEHAGFPASTVELVEAHGTGTKAGDAAEFGGLEMAFNESGREDRQWCAIGSVKSQIGHTKAAAGAAGLFKAVMALHHKALPPTIKVDRPNPKLELEKSPFYVNTELRPWVRPAGHPRRAGVSSFGFGGSNFHLALEEYAGEHRAPLSRVTGSELVVLGAASPEALLQALAAVERVDEPGYLSWLAHHSQSVFSTESVARLAVVARDEAELFARLDEAAAKIEKAPKKAFSSPKGIDYGCGHVPGKVGFLFPGQGSQYVGMGAEVALTWSQSLAIWDLAAGLDAFEERLDQVVFPRPVFTDEARAAQQAHLTETQWAQPAIGAASLAALQVLQTVGLTPDAVGGHSYGEVTALHVAGVLDRESMLRVARRRGELMAEAAQKPGSMTAVAARIEQVREIVEASGVPVVVANHNSPTQVVLSGPTPAIEAIEKVLDQHDVMARRLPVATAFHSSVVADSVAPFGEFLAGVEVKAPEITVYANSEAAPYSSDPEDIRRILAHQIASPVRFVEQVLAMYEAGVRTFVEVGPNAVLTGLVGRILRGKEHTVVQTDRKGKDGTLLMHQALGKLLVAGLSPQLSALWEGFTVPVDPRTIRQPRLAMPLNGANYNKPYPPPEGASALPAPNPEHVPQVVVKEVEVIKEIEVVKEVPVHVAAPAQATATHAPAPQAAAPASSGWVNAFQESQRQTVEAHQAFQQAMTTSHTAFLQAMESSFAQLNGMMTGQPVAYALAQAPVVQAPVVPVVPVAAAPVAPAPVYAAPAPVALPLEPIQATVVTPAEPTVDLDALMNFQEPVAAAPAASPAAPSVDMHALLMQVVAEKTGYPAEMLSSEMNLEADLGIDSIKRVEILSAMREEAPQLPEVDAGAMAELQTLGQIVDYMKAQLPEGGAVTSAPVAAAPSVDLHALLMQVVAEKTGYPAEMLSSEMNLEADLGIDSIKRVEILSAMREEAPQLPEVDAGAMAELQTLGQIVDYMKAQLPAGGAVAAAPVAAAPSVDLHALLMQVVAEKTGYPAEMLSSEMNLEADLGIDSIKRVEILSAMREEAPQLPEVDAGAMAELQTLGQIVDYMNGQLPPAALGVSASAPVAAAAPAAPSLDLHGLLMSVVADKTGYPAEMLSAEMNLEADLGIDSIKRVEILSAMREEAPQLPEVDAGAMAELQTLGQIVDYMNAQLGVTTEASAPVVQTVEAAAPRHDLGRHVVMAVPAEAAGLGMDGVSLDGPVTVTPDGGGVAEALVSALQERGIEAEVSEALLRGSKKLVFLGGLSADGSADAALATSRSAFQLARELAPRVAEGGLFVTVQDTGGDFGLSGSDRAWFGGLSGLAKTAAQEWPAAGVKAIDLERGERSAVELAQALAEELASGGPELEVGLSASGQRVTLVTRDIAVEGGSSVVGSDSVVLASGGARGVTAATLVALAESTQASFVLLGRTPLAQEDAALAGLDESGLKRALLERAKAAGSVPKPVELNRQVQKVLAQREVRDNLAAIEKVGGKAIYLAADVTDAGALSEALSTARSTFGPITTLVHGAGVLADRFIADKTDDQFDFVVDTKVGGLRALLEATAGDPVTSLVFFSSVAARGGNQGQCDYAMANEVLNKVGAWIRADRGVVVKSLGWGPWEGGMVTPALKARFESLGVPLIPLATGAKMLVDELTNSSADVVEICLGGEPKAEALLAEDSAPKGRYEVRVNELSHPWLADHAIAGQPVIPVVLVTEWFARAAKATRPDLHLVAVREVEVRKGIRIDNFQTGEGFSVNCRQLSNGDGAVLGLELTDAAGRVRYTAKARMKDGAATFEGKDADLKLGSFQDDVYGGVLFHGPELQVIRSVDGVGKEGLSASLDGVSGKSWREPWSTDVAAMDGGLQMALLWSKHVLGGKSLPTRVGQLKLYGSGPSTGPIQAVLQGREVSGSKTVSDIVFTSESGEVVAELEGVETHKLS